MFYIPFRKHIMRYQEEAEISSHESSVSYSRYGQVDHILRDVPRNTFEEVYYDISCVGPTLQILLGAANIHYLPCDYLSTYDFNSTPTLARTSNWL